MRKIACYILLGFAAAVLGCTSNSGQNNANSQLPNRSDSGRWEPVSLGLLAQQDLATMTVPLVGKALRYPRAVRVIDPPKFKADYDKARGVTEVSAFGNGISVSPYSGEVTQGYWVEWEIRAKINPDSRPDTDDWNLVGSVQTFEAKFPLIK